MAITNKSAPKPPAVIKQTYKDNRFGQMSKAQKQALKAKETERQAKIKAYAEQLDEETKQDDEQKPAEPQATGPAPDAVSPLEGKQKKGRKKGAA